MTDASGGNRRTDQDRGVADAASASSAAREPDGIAPPERPDLSDHRPPPILRADPPPTAVKAARVLWLLSFTAGAAAMLIAFLSQEPIEAELEETLLRLAPGYDEASIASLVDVVYWSCLAGLGVVVAVEAILLAMLLNRRGGARWVQLPLLVAHAGVAIVAGAFLTVGQFGLIVGALIVGGLVLAIAAWIAGVLPSANRWLRARGEVQPATLH